MGSVDEASTSIMNAAPKVVVPAGPTGWFVEGWGHNARAQGPGKTPCPLR